MDKAFSQLNPVYTNKFIPPPPTEVTDAAAGCEAFLCNIRGVSPSNQGFENGIPDCGSSSIYLVSPDCSDEA
jgi:hypothetical protein